MFTPKIFVFAILIISVSCRYISEEQRPYLVIEDDDSIRIFALEDEPDANEVEELHPIRVRRQVHGSLSSNLDGSSNVAAKIPIARGDSNILSAIGTVNAADGKGGFGSAGAGLAWDNM